MANKQKKTLEQRMKELDDKKAKLKIRDDINKLRAQLKKK